MSRYTQTEEEFLELVQNYPSPHNGQPMVLRRMGANNYEVLFETDRGLRATPISYLFSFVTVGVFFEYFRACADALGHTMKEAIDLPPVQDMSKPHTQLPCGLISIEWNTHPVDSTLKKAIEFRQTSRKKYTSGLSAKEKSLLESHFSRTKTKLSFLDVEKAHQTIWLNQRAVFDDMFNDDVREELRHWLRTSHEEKVSKKDGLSYDCMEISGRSLRFSLDHHKVLRLPVVAPILKWYYLRTMKDDSSVGYLTAPFVSERDGFIIGRQIMQLWLRLSEWRSYLHPFGTIAANKEAHQDFRKLVGIPQEIRNNNTIVFIFRAGRSAPPNKSERLGRKHIVKE